MKRDEQSTSASGDDRSADRRCEALGAIAVRAVPEGEANLAEWRAVASALQARRPRRVLWVVPVAAALALVAGWRVTLAYKLDNCTVNESDRLTVKTADGTVSFIDGSRFTLAPGTEAEIRPRAFRRGAELRLHRGHASVSVVHRFAGRWDVLAGPFDVHVTGTRFEVDWEPNSRHFDVLVREGEVRVTGGTIGEKTRVRTGQMLSIQGTDIRLGSISTAPARPASPDSPTARETLRPAPEAETPRLPDAAPKHVRSPVTHRRAIPAHAPTERPTGEPTPLGKASLGYGFGGGRATVPEESQERHHTPGANGAIFTSVGERTRFLSPASESANHLYRENGMLCTNVRIPAVFCSANTPPDVNCDWSTNWGVVLGWNPRADRRPWGEAQAARISFEYQGPKGLYRLTAHRAGDPSSKVYCVDSYVSGQVVAPSDFHAECWTSGGAALSDFSTVDTFALHRPSTNSRQTLQLCINSVSLY